MLALKKADEFGLINTPTPCFTHTVLFASLPFPMLCSDNNSTKQVLGKYPERTLFQQWPISSSPICLSYLHTDGQLGRPKQKAISRLF